MSRVGIRPQLQVLASVRFLAFVGFGFPGSLCPVFPCRFPGPGPLSALSCPAGLVLLWSWSVSLLGLVFVRFVCLSGRRCWGSVARLVGLVSSCPWVVRCSRGPGYGGQAAAPPEGVAGRAPPSHDGLRCPGSKVPLWVGPLGVAAHTCRLGGVCLRVCPVATDTDTDRKVVS